ncbi:SAM-dependent methyltransferase [Pseudonocardia sp. TRM90224]|uniref:SAM-dependent methyltransferase n=1 Tax=Pseudonocardia sp. TRM90224 TaxID=2812678 RepID=UPI001E29B6A3|nr:SAM-dependent methyltransferase [Pseudonocardia sp. TRM90224]
MGDGRGHWIDDDNFEQPLPEIDLTRASNARVYDYVLGGKDHFEVDRRAAEAMYRVVPETPLIARDNRLQQHRAVSYLVREAGIRQIIDLGSGLPAVGNVHEVAHEIDPQVRVVYVDNDPMVLAHGRAMLANDETTAVIAADVRDVEAVFAAPDTIKLIDLAEPFAVIASSLLHYLDDDEAATTAAAIRERLTPGSYLMLGNFLDDDEDRAKELERAFMEGDLGGGRFRSWGELQSFFDGLEMVEPGLVYANDWRPDEETPEDSPVHTLYAVGMAQKPTG